MSTRQKWQQRVEQWKKSGQTAAVFAAEHGLKAGTLLWWSSALRRSHGHASELGFARLVASDDTPSAPSESAPLDIVLASGRIVRVRKGFDPDLLRDLLSVLEAP